MDIVVTLLEGALLVLVCALCVQMLMLYRSGAPLQLSVFRSIERLAPEIPAQLAVTTPQASTSPYFDRISAISHCRTLLAIQMMDCKRKGIDPRTTHAAAIHQITAAYLCGCARQLVESAGGSDSDMSEFQGNALCQHLKMNLLEASELVQQLQITTGHDDMLGDVYRRGVMAARHWQVKRYAPDELSLHQAITDWNLI